MLTIFLGIILHLKVASNWPNSFFYRAVLTFWTLFNSVGINKHLQTNNGNAPQQTLHFGNRPTVQDIIFVRKGHLH